MAGHAARAASLTEFQAFAAGARRSLEAIFTKSAREPAFIFYITLPRCISASLADQPIAGVNGSVSMMTKGGVNTMTRSLAIEYARDGIRFNAVAPGVVDTPMHKDDSKDSRELPPMGKIASVKDIVDAVFYLAQAGHVTGEILHVDGGAHAGRW